MALESLTSDEQWIVRQALAALCHGTALDDPDLVARVGVGRAELARLLARWPQVHDTRPDAPDGFVINNCLNEVCHGIAWPPDEWNRWFDVPPERVAAVYARWAMLKGWSSPGAR
jgi:hypothetical protein